MFIRSLNNIHVLLFDKHLSEPTINGIQTAIEKMEDMYKENLKEIHKMEVFNADKSDKGSRKYKNYAKEVSEKTISIQQFTLWKAF